MNGAMLDSTDLRMALVAVKYYLRAHQLAQRTPDLAAFRLAHHLEDTIMSVDGHDPVGAQQHLLTVKQLAEHTGVSERHARRIASRVGRKIGRQWLTPVDAVTVRTNY